VSVKPDLTLFVVRVRDKYKGDIFLSHHLVWQASKEEAIEQTRQHAKHQGLDVASIEVIGQLTGEVIEMSKVEDIIRERRYT